MESRNADKVTEAEIQFELAYRLKKIGFTVQLERNFKLDESFDYSGKNRLIRIDILVLKYDKIICAVEIKNYTEKVKMNKETYQFKKYSSLGIPFVYCLRESEMDSCIKKILKIYLGTKKKFSKSSSQKLKERFNLLTQKL